MPPATWFPLNPHDVEEEEQDESKTNEGATTVESGLIGPEEDASASSRAAILMGENPDPLSSSDQGGGAKQAGGRELAGKEYSVCHDLKGQTGKIWSFAVKSYQVSTIRYASQVR